KIFCTPKTTCSPAATRKRMAAWKRPPIRMPTRFAVTATGRAGSDLPGVDPLDELGARRLHRGLRRHDLDRVDRDEVVGVLGGRDAWLEVAHLDVVLPPRPLARERVPLDAFERLRHVGLGRPLPGGGVGLLDRRLVGLDVEIGVVALVGWVLAVLGLVL